MCDKVDLSMEINKNANIFLLIFNFFCVKLFYVFFEFTYYH